MPNPNPFPNGISGRDALKRWRTMKKGEKDIIISRILQDHKTFPGCGSLTSRTSSLLTKVLTEFRLPNNKKNSNFVRLYLKHNLSGIQEISKICCHLKQSDYNAHNDIANDEEGLEIENITLFCGTNPDMVDRPVNDISNANSNDLNQKQGNGSTEDKNGTISNQIKEQEINIVSNNALLNPENNNEQQLPDISNSLVCDSENADDPSPVVKIDSHRVKSKEILHVPDENLTGSVTVRFPVILPNADGKQEEHCRRNFKCTGNIGQFTIEQHIWKAMVDEEGKLLTTVYPTIISDKFYELEKGCVVQMQNVNYKKKSSKRREAEANRKPILTIYAYCGHNKNTAFKFICYKLDNSNDVQVDVFTNVKECFHPTKKTRELSGIARDTVKHELLNSGATLVRLNQVKKCDPEGVKANNIQDIKSYSVFRKAKAEAVAVDDLHKNGLFDLFIMRDNEDTSPDPRYL